MFRTCKNTTSIDYNKKSTKEPKNDLNNEHVRVDASAPDEKPGHHGIKKSKEKQSNFGKQNQPVAASQSDDQKVVKKIEPFLSPESIIDEKPKISMRSKKEYRPKHYLRYDGKNHLPRFDSNDYASRCKNEDCKYKTNVICTKCSLHLCFTRARNCFENFHTLELCVSD